MPRDVPPITAETLLMAYASGVFPMAESRDDPDIFWVDPKLRGVMPMGGPRLSRSLRRTIRREPFLLTLDEAFDRVVAACADRDETWINPSIAALYGELHRAGFAHSLEAWEGERLVGGVYGVAMGRAFFGESMFSASRDASKVALAHLMATLRRDGFALFDTQFITPHLASLGAVEVTRATYRGRLARALEGRARLDRPVAGAEDVLGVARGPR